MACDHKLRLTPAVRHLARNATAVSQVIRSLYLLCTLLYLATSWTDTLSCLAATLPTPHYWYNVGCIHKLKSKLRHQTFVAEVLGSVLVLPNDVMWNVKGTSPFLVTRSFMIKQCHISQLLLYYYKLILRFEFLMVVKIKLTVIWNMLLYILADRYHFGRSYNPHILVHERW